MRYALQNGPNNITWVSLEPLLEDICEQLDNPDNQENQLVIDSLFAVKAFIHALIEEGKFQHYRHDDSDELSYRDSLQ